MQTHTLFAYEVDNNDFVVIDGRVVGYVYSVNDDTDFILLDTVDDEGEHTQWAFGPFDSITLVSSFEEDGSVPEEWEHFYAEGGPFDQNR